jgi:SHS2 domain-containing protein
MKRFEELDHTADWAFRAYGRTRAELYENAAYALFSLQGSLDAAPGVDDTRETTTRHVEVQGIDYESVLVNWLSELLYLQETQKETYFDFDVEHLSPTALHATIHGRRIGHLNKFVKAITYHDLEIRETPEGWQATVVVDV